MERNVPKLRFNGFNDEWEEKKLGSMGKALIGLTYSPDNISDKENGLLVLRSSNIKDGHLNYNDNVYVNMPVKDDIRVRKNDILLCSRNGSKALIGKSALIDSDINATFGAFMTVIRANNGKFINQLINTREFFRQINMNLGATINQITSSNLNNFKFKVPSHQEQERIANFLTKVDKIIEKQDEKVKNLEKYKKGMMQKIFSQEIRFKDENGKEYPDWKNQRLNELLYESKERNINGKFKKENVLSVSGEFGIVNQIKLLGRSFAGESIDNYHVVNKGDIVYTKSPLKSNPYGIIKANKGEAGVVSTLYAVYKCKDNVVSEYLDYYFELDDNTNKYIRPLVNKGAKNDMKINNEYFLSDKIMIPSKKEQEKIVMFFETFDRVLKKDKEKSNELKQWKKGLLQQMFV